MTQSPIIQASCAHTRAEDGGSTCARLVLAEAGCAIEADTSKNILENLETNHIPIRSQCRSGICGVCRLTVISGNCRFEPDFCLSDRDRANGHALACCTFPQSGDITIALHATR